MPGLEPAVWLGERKLGTARNYSIVYVGKQRAISSGLNCECLYLQPRELSQLSDEVNSVRPRWWETFYACPTLRFICVFNPLPVLVARWWCQWGVTTGDTWVCPCPSPGNPSWTGQHLQYLEYLEYLDHPKYLECMEYLEYLDYKKYHENIDYFEYFEYLGFWSTLISWSSWSIWRAWITWSNWITWSV